ncbi:MAG: zinc-binding dehydrogenase [Deltaproteobacteria bacterium]|nr:zinc-binding dehydrogenase [Deltaproteobacteria bacterium]
MYIIYRLDWPNLFSKVFPFDEAPAAHRFIESRKSTGKVLLKIVKGGKNECI